MRLSVASLRRMIKGKLHVEFVRQELTSYSGLELLRRYLRQLDLLCHRLPVLGVQGGPRDPRDHRAGQREPGFPAGARV